ncbi:hypothetical protein [Bradyrhizobium sp. DOA9]|uniref:hypothetical protein n=1 Tax=Bradyrhizobium sp. DOA9 TaxID=1126627 RepID=UPI00046B0AD7|nr:hypothetical protein [Bradyrhizobium sp. DOA9]GAJ37607.1 hypothetical protein BDOA9_0202250 [Bradyrhizobium sp. DOA9]
MQIQNDGTHVILLVATPFAGRLDHAGVPVMWLRHTDGEMRRDDVRAALLQRFCAVDERARVHGAPGLSLVAMLRAVDAKTLSQQREEATRGAVIRIRPVRLSITHNFDHSS